MKLNSLDCYKKTTKKPHTFNDIQHANFKLVLLDPHLAFIYSLHCISYIYEHV